MKTPPRSRRGFTLVETVIAAALTAVVLVAGGSMMGTTSSASNSICDVGIASTRTQHVLLPVAERIRGASLATVQNIDGTSFLDGETGTAVRLRMVNGFAGAATLAAPVSIRFDRAAGAATGSVVLDDGTGPRVLAREVTAFAITRAGSTFTVSATTRSGPADDRVRTSSGSVAARPRNP